MLNRQIYQQINILNDKMQLNSHTAFDFTKYLIKIAKISYAYGFAEPKTSDDLPIQNPYIFKDTCCVDMNNWNW